MKSTIKLPMFFLMLLLISCGGDDDGGNVTPPPAVASLIFPEDNTECNEGIIISDTQSTVVFRWEASENTDTYNVNIRNLNTGQTTGFMTTDTELQANILRGTPYAWWVISSNTGTEMAESETWRFYNAGLPVTNYTPFPAALRSPMMGVAVDAPSGEIMLEWTGQDIDQDIVEYEVYFGTDFPPVDMASVATTPMLNVNVSSGEIYYWSVLTKDSQGNTSSSEIFQFRVN